MGLTYSGEDEITEGLVGLFTILIVHQGDAVTGVYTC